MMHNGQMTSLKVYSYNLEGTKRSLVREGTWLKDGTILISRKFDPVYNKWIESAGKSSNGRFWYDKYGYNEKYNVNDLSLIHISTGSNKVSKVTLSSKTENDKLDDILINYSYSYDSYDNPIKEIVDYGNGQKLTIDNKYTNHTGNIYLLGELYEQTITNEKSTAKISKKTLTTFDTKRQPINRKSYTNNNLTNEESFSYDLYGNVIESQTKAYASTFWLSNKFIYDTYGRLTRKTNKLGLFVDYSYDSKFRMISEKNNKAQQTTYVYDNWDRSTKVTYPDGKMCIRDRRWTAQKQSGP